MRGVKYFETPAVDKVGETWVDRLKRFFRLGNPAPAKGRKWIDPCKPYGHWASGWYSEAIPERNREGG